MSVVHFCIVDPVAPPSFRSPFSPGAGLWGPYGRANGDNNGGTWSPVDSAC